jgi:anti-sigma B factor antagonist
MAVSPLVIKVREINRVIVFDIEGEMRRHDTPQVTLSSLVQGELDRGRRNVVFNLAGVGFIDSFGVGEILASFKSIQDLGGKLKLCEISDKLLLIFRITMLDKVLDIRENCGRALDSFDGA